MVRVGGGYVTIEEFANRMSSSLARKAKQDNLAKIEQESKASTVVKPASPQAATEPTT